LLHRLCKVALILPAYTKSTGDHVLAQMPEVL